MVCDELPLQKQSESQSPACADVFALTPTQKADTYKLHCKTVYNNNNNK